MELIQLSLLLINLEDWSISRSFEDRAWNINIINVDDNRGELRGKFGKTEKKGGGRRRRDAEAAVVRPFFLLPGATNRSCAVGAALKTRSHPRPSAGACAMAYRSRRIRDARNIIQWSIGCLQNTISPFRRRADHRRFVSINENDGTTRQQWCESVAFPIADRPHESSTFRGIVGRYVMRHEIDSREWNSTRGDWTEVRNFSFDTLYVNVVIDRSIDRIIIRKKFKISSRNSETILF